jgi:type I restriction enzyme S subunit
VNRNRLPKGWNFIELRKLADKINTKNHGFAHSLVLTNSAQRGIIPQSEHFHKNIAISGNIDDYCIVERGDFVYNPRISTAAPCGPIRRNNLKTAGVVSPLYTVFRLKDSKANGCYIEYFFLSSAWHGYVKTVANYGARHDRMNLTNDDFFAMPIPMPPYAERKAIVNVLNSADKLIAAKERLIAEKRKQRGWLMQNLLTAGLRLSGFEEEWITKPFGELFDFYGGIFASRAQLSSKGYHYLHYGDIHKLTQTFVDVDGILEIPRLDIAMEKIPRTSLLHDGDVVFVDASEDYDGVSGHVVVRNLQNKPFISGGHTIIAKSNSCELDNRFKEYCFRSEEVRTQFKLQAVGAKVLGVNKTSIKKIALTFPPNLLEQQAIAETLITADQEIELLTKELEQQKLLKKYLMQQLLTGKIRVKGDGI